MAKNFRISLTETRVYFKTAIVSAENEVEARRFALQSGPWHGETQVLHDTIRSVTGAEYIKTETEIQAEIAKLQRDLAALQGFAAKPAKPIGRGESAYLLRKEGKTWAQVAKALGLTCKTPLQSARSAAVYYAKTRGLKLV